MENKTLLVFYDDWCPLCKKSKAIIEEIDKFNKIEFLGVRDNSICEKYNIPQEKAVKEIYSINLKNNKTYKGIHTILEITKICPSTWIFAPFIFLGIKIGLGKVIYNYIANKRKIVPVGKCDDNGCSIHREN